MKLIILKLKDRFWTNYLFLAIVLIIYLISWIINSKYFINVWLEVYNIITKQILSALIIVFIIMFILNIILEKDKIKELIEKSSNITKYIASIIWWILSTWPVYMWYPLLKKLKHHWLNYWQIAIFIYSRSIKLPFISVMILYFGLKYTIIFNCVLILQSIILWIIINSIMEKK